MSCFNAFSSSIMSCVSVCFVYAEAQPKSDIHSKHKETHESLCGEGERILIPQDEEEERHRVVDIWLI